jgi:hypothetical protein
VWLDVSQYVKFLKFGRTLFMSALRVHCSYVHKDSGVCTCILQAFINTAAKIYQKIEEGIFDVSNEVSSPLCKLVLLT